VVKGKYMYMAPEQARSGSVDRRADVFSLGVSLYEALTNVRPFARDNDLAILNAVLQCDFKPPKQVRPDLPIELEQTVQKSLQLDPARRYQSAAELASDLERFLAATTSGSGHTALSTFMGSFFGPERVAAKTRIDSLPDLAQKGWDVPGYANPSSPKTDPSGTPARRTTSDPDAVTKMAGMTPSVVDRRRRVGAAFIGALVGAGVLLIGSVAMFAFFKQSANTPDAGPAMVVPVAAQDAGEAVVTAPVDAGGATQVAEAAVVDAGAKENATAVKPVCPPGAKPTQLVMKAVKDHYGELTACLDKFKAELPADQGNLTVKFHIIPNGRIIEAATDLPGTKVSSCVEERLKVMRVACYNGGDVTANLPLHWNVKR
jgi:serine/threonine-protein kinase